MFFMHAARAFLRAYPTCRTLLLPILMSQKCVLHVRLAELLKLKKSLKWEVEKRMSRFNITLLFSDSTNPRELWSLEPPTFQKFWTSMLLRAFLMFGISLLKLRKLCRKTPCLERFVAGAC